MSDTYTTAATRGPSKMAQMRHEVETMRSARGPVWTIARFVLVEALRSGLPGLVIVAALAAVGIAGFLAHVAITESVALQSALTAALLRACAVFLVAAHVIASAQRETNDKVLEVVLALPVSRTAYYLGKLAGFAACGAAVAVALGLPLLLWSPPGAVVLWVGSLAVESALVAAAALFFSAVLRQTVSALSATLGLYLLARAMATIQSMAGGPLVPDSPLAHAERWVIDAIALLLPRLDMATRTEWLLYGLQGGLVEYGATLAGLGLYVALLTAAGLFDFHRRSL